ncbi:Zinc/cadmium resistance protein [Lamellibrachia satsuma]|nr:Zinc/cadmium resistance protein [Lamellibrachia satsuma]
MLALTGGFFLVEIIVGYMTNSLALVGDSYHMLSDVIALLVGYASVRISRWQSKKNTYGWVRAEVLGALVNAVFLIALCFTIFIEALQRLFHDEHIKDPKLMLIVGGLGLFINLIGLGLFSGHGHSHGGGGGHGHGHSHGGHGHSHNSDSHNSDSNEEESCSDVHSHEPYELTSLKDAKQTSNGVLANVVVESDDEGDKTDDELQGNGRESTPR